MSVKKYESVVIINANIEEAQIENEINGIQEIFKANNVVVWDADKVGRKRLAYPIKKSRSGYYVVFRFDSETDFVKKYERLLRLNENIYRFLTIMLDKNAVDYIQKIKKEASDKAVAAQENSTPA